MSVRILTGDCRDVLRTLEAESVHCIVTSPPYFGLRDYGVPGQIGLEQTPAEYVAELVAVFRECRRVLRQDGTLWLNLGDSYAGSGKGGNPEGSPWKGFVGNTAREAAATVPNGKSRLYGHKPKDLIGIPWQVAFALRDDGWYLRSDIIWHKPNPMPESVTDRPTSAHEHIFLLSKSRSYFFDAVAVKEADVAGHKSGNGYARVDTKNVGYRLSYGGRGQEEQWEPGNGRNIRNVWTVATQPYSEAHFATFPPALIEPCIKAGTSEKGCCPTCGAPWVRNVERETRPNAPSCNGKYDGIGKHRTVSGGVSNDAREKRVIGWLPSCSCYPPLEDAPACFKPRLEPCVVLDPFGGAGTTGVVADRLQRSAILIELNPEYADMARSRVSKDRGALLDWIDGAAA